MSVGNGAVRSMPAYGTAECGIALEICEWAHTSQEAHNAAPDLVVFLRKYVEAPGWSWREVYDQALRIWQRGYEQQCAVKELF